MNLGIRFRSVFLISGIFFFLLLIWGCGNQNPAGPGAGTVITAQYFKLTAGNSWTTSTVTTGTLGGIPTTLPSAITTTAYGAATASGTPVYINNVLISYISIDASGQVITTDAVTGSSVVIPATLNVGTSYNTTVAGISVTATVAAIDATVTVAGLGTFNDCLQFNLSGNAMVNGVSSTLTGTMYLSKSVGHAVQATINATGTVNGIPATATVVSTLQPGYISN